MRVWRYERLSNDDGREMNSLLNQREICRAYAEKHGHIVVGSSFDDNVSGMKFSRRGLDAKDVGVEETNPQRPHFCVTGKNQIAGARDR